MSKPKKTNDLSILSSEIRYFIVVYEQKSINAAARRLGQSPGNISRSLAKLEKSSGAPLFVRHKNGLSPVDSGERLYLAVTKARDAFLRNIAQEGEARRIRVGFYSTIGYAHFSERMTAALLGKNVSPEFVIDTSGNLVEMIKRRDLDFALVHNPVKFPGLVSRSFATEGVLLCSIASREQETLLAHPDILGIEEALGSISYRKRWLIQDYFVIARMLVQNSSLMGVIPESVFRLHPELRELKRLTTGKITALSWPGSAGLTLLKCIEKQ